MRIVLIQLNEINFDIAKKYIKVYLRLKNLRKNNKNSSKTIEEEKYRNLEPWIQWVSVFRGLALQRT